MSERKHQTITSRPRVHVLWTLTWLTRLLTGASVCREGRGMTRQLNLRVSDESAESLERLSRRVGRPMAAVLESVGTPAIEAAEADAQFEAETLVAWEEYQLNGVHIGAPAIDDMFAEALALAGSIAEKRVI
jgi:predicted DNA-binding protein